MSLTRMPIFAWYILITAFMIAVGFPPLIIGSILLELQRLLGLPFFDPSVGGDPLLWQHLFWLFGHPEVYIIFLPAAGMVATMLPTFCRVPIFGYGFLVAAVISMGFISFGLWAHHMFTTGLPILSLSLFSAASTMVTIPTGVQIFCFIATIAIGRPRLTVPMLFILGFLFIFVMGGLTGVMLASVPFNWQAHDTHFVVAHLHYVLIGGMIFPLFGAFFYWWPHFTGKMMSERVGSWVFWLMFGGFHLTFFLMHITGLRGMPRRIATYPEGIGWDRLNMLSTLGSYIFAAGVLLFIIEVIRSYRSGAPAGYNPWGAPTLEWLYPTVTPGFNFHEIPPIHSREPLWDQTELTDRPAETVGGVMRGTPDHRRETVGCDPVTGEPIQVLRLPHPTWIPMIAAGMIAVAAIGALLGFYWLVAAGIAGMFVAFFAWGWEPSDSGVEREVGLGYRLPVNAIDRRSHTHVAMIGTILILFALYASLLFGALYLWNTQPDFALRMARPDSDAAAWAAVAAVLLVGCALAGRWAATKDQRALGFLLNLGTVGLSVLTMAALFRAVTPIDPYAVALGAVIWTTAGFAGANLFFVAIWAGFNALRKAAGQVGVGQGLPDFNLATMAWATGVMSLATALALVFGTIGGGVPGPGGM